MHDINLITQNPQKFKYYLEIRNEDPSIIDRLLEINSQRKELITKINNLRNQKNNISDKIARKQYSSEEERQLLVKDSNLLDREIKDLEPILSEVEQSMKNILLNIPNIVAEDVPVGKDSNDNQIIYTEEEGLTPNFDPLPHWEIAEKLNIIDFERGVKLSGSRFYIMKGKLAKLQRALINFFLDFHTQKHNYKELYLPFIVKGYCLEGAGQLPKFEDNLYKDLEDDMWLVPTAEVPLTNIYRDEILPADVLPLYYVAYTPCFRKEKIAAGRDVRGIKRGHQFDKVELYKFTLPENSDYELEKLVQDACDILRALKLSFRIVKLCSGDLGFSSAKTYDIEVWAAGCKEWLEVSSCSNVLDFQARRANIRFRRTPQSKPEYVHTLNGSGLALPRVVIAILENYQQKDGTIRIPEVLQPYTGFDQIEINWKY
ncbi:MAG: serine--tRNA ligase [Candidatus Calescibacterium sp.]|nr:serine--tRNA ligase [Candidatus Calescibacterium sp.]MCX7972849.1 serine--tRNA ligase [bacterium]MDW8195229.1 serine--tRNA ligase [Candidatus Calescibacterium sp.]